MVVVMAAKGSVANIRKKLMSRFSSGDDRHNSPGKTARSAADMRTDAADRSASTSKKDWSLHHPTKNHQNHDSQQQVWMEQSQF